ncbi:hypothetical protein P3X46_004381 [Hevea brasiliensis]|uniref:DC1 domain-containing protein n=1 Tax=Hevea brasiliensis TaxID=3981 RepID=A0ABQ9MYU1_HEVBR|nr:hypothetical protein P3X46_004381 [Hevea brasiliensis]
MEVAEKHSFNHFSHQHPLEISTLPSTTDNKTCYGCNLRILPGKDYYDCKTCLFSLHRICSNMPRKTRHPAHPYHYLSLLTSPPSSNSTFKCKACGHFISGFYYNCAECGIYYHILCSALPLSVAICSHPHTLKIEFSPPYAFCCDLCDKPSYVGWLYRCRFCEFDAHISCAISIQRAQPGPLPNTLTRQIVYSSASIMETNRLIDYGIESNELMQLVVQGVTRGNHQDTNCQEIANDSAVAGWDERLRSPRKNLEIGNGGIGRFRLHQREPQISSNGTSPLNGSRNKDPSVSVSEDLTIPSYQFSDQCFSIDLMKSCSSLDNRSQTKKESNHQDVVPEDEARISCGKLTMPDNKTSSNKPVFNPLYKAPENWLKEASLLEGVNRYDGMKLGQNGENRTVNGGRPGIKEHGAKSNRARWSCLCWWKLLRCCYYSRYEKCSKSFKNGGL